MTKRKVTAASGLPLGSEIRGPAPGDSILNDPFADTGPNLVVVARRKTTRVHVGILRALRSGAFAVLSERLPWGAAPPLPGFLSPVGPLPDQFRTFFGIASHFVAIYSMRLCTLPLVTSAQRFRLNRCLVIRGKVTLLEYDEGRPSYRLPDRLIVIYD